MALLWGKHVSVWVSELRAEVSWWVGTEGKLCKKKEKKISKCRFMRRASQGYLIYQGSVVAFWRPRRHQVEVRSPTV